MFFHQLLLITAMKSTEFVVVSFFGCVLLRIRLHVMSFVLSVELFIMCVFLCCCFSRSQTSDTQSFSPKCDAQCTIAFVDSYSSCERKKLQVQNSPVWTVQGRVLGGIIVFCSLKRHFTLTVPLFTQKYKWLPTNCWGNLTVLGRNL